MQLSECPSLFVHNPNARPVQKSQGDEWREVRDLSQALWILRQQRVRRQWREKRRHVAWETVMNECCVMWLDGVCFANVVSCCWLVASIRRRQAGKKEPKQQERKDPTEEGQIRIEKREVLF
jgi:hypothetical protein